MNRPLQYFWSLKLRTIRLYEFLICSGLIIFALYLQHSEGLAPCPMCILQRYAFILVGSLALVSAALNINGIINKLLSITLVAVSGAGTGVAIRHVWLEHNPPQIFDCGADLGFMMENFPLADALPMIFKGTGDCSIVLWTFMNFSIAEWSLVFLTAILFLEVSLLYRAFGEGKQTINAP